MAKRRVRVKIAKHVIERSKSNKDFQRISVRLPVKLHKLAKKSAKHK